jgi:cell division transport system ATP-binding protein
LIQTFHVYKQYGRDAAALSDVTLEIDKGEFVFLTGPSGAGKTTFLKLIFREETPTQGQILVNGRNVSAIPEAKIPFLRRDIGVVFQDFKLLRRKTVFENVAFVLRVMGIPKAERKRRAYQILKQVGLHHKINSYPLQLSGGEQQRIAIARALINEPVLLLADEPTGNLDTRTGEQIMRIFHELHTEGITIVLVTHEMDIAVQADRIIRMTDGQIIEDTSVDDRQREQMLASTQDWFRKLFEQKSAARVKDVPGEELLPKKETAG